MRALIVVLALLLPSIAGACPPIMRVKLFPSDDALLPRQPTLYLRDDYGGATVEAVSNGRPVAIRDEILVGDQGHAWLRRLRVDASEGPLEIRVHSREHRWYSDVTVTSYLVSALAPSGNAKVVDARLSGWSTTLKMSGNAALYRMEWGDGETRFDSEVYLRGQSMHLRIVAMFADGSEQVVLDDDYDGDERRPASLRPTDSPLGAIAAIVLLLVVGIASLRLIRLDS